MAYAKVPYAKLKHWISYQKFWKITNIFIRTRNALKMHMCKFHPEAAQINWIPDCIQIEFVFRHSMYDCMICIKISLCILWISLHFSKLLCISVHFSAFLYTLYFRKIWQSVPSSYGRNFSCGNDSLKKTVASRFML